MNTQTHDSPRRAPVAEIVAVGTELLMGQTVNTNAAFLARELARLSIHCYYQTLVGDNPERLARVLEQAFRRADIVLTIGGLGPTQDDLTKETMAEVLDVPLQFDPEIWDVITERFTYFGEGDPADSNRKQAYIPQGGEPLPNPHGTAPGTFVTVDDKIAACLPGPPREFEPMVTGELAPRLRSLVGGGQTMFSRTLRVVGVGESALEQRFKDLISGQSNPTIAPYAKLGEVHIRLTANADSCEEARALTRPVEEELVSRLGSNIYGYDDTPLEAATGELLVDQGLHLAVAESCTGGLVGQRFTSVPGASQFFRGGVIAYADEVKQSSLKVPPEVLAEHGAVSEQTAEAMAKGAQKAAGAQVTVAVTGIAGPGGGSDEKPVGLVYIGWAKHDKVRMRRFMFPGDREEVRWRTSQAAIDGLRRWLLDC